MRTSSASASVRERGAETHRRCPDDLEQSGAHHDEEEEPKHDRADCEGALVAGSGFWNLAPLVDVAVVLFRLVVRDPLRGSHDSARRFHIFCPFLYWSLKKYKQSSAGIHALAPGLEKRGAPCGRGNRVPIGSLSAR